MKYDFETAVDRKGTNTIAVDCIGKHPIAPSAPLDGFEPIPMWVADMCFATYPKICERIADRLTHPCFGYFEPGDEFYNAIKGWQERRNGVKNIKTEDIQLDNGVLAGVVATLGAVCSKGDNVLVHSPCYIGFTMALENNGYNPVHSELVKDENGIYRMDFSDMEKKIEENNIHAAIICSPHNPAGRVWEKWELEKAMEIFERHSVYVVSDEIWSDIILFGNRHIPTQSVSEYAKYHTAACYAITKTFNLAGLVGSYRIIYDKWLRDRVEKEASLSHANEQNVFSMEATVAAYDGGGEEWLSQLCGALSENAAFAAEYVKSNFPGVSVTAPEGTYMMFVDCTGYCENHGITIKDLEKRLWDHGIDVQDGCMFFGNCHIRINLASPKKLIEEAFDRMKKYVFI